MGQKSSLPFIPFTNSDEVEGAAEVQLVKEFFAPQCYVYALVSFNLCINLHFFPTFFAPKEIDTLRNVSFNWHTKKDDLTDM